MLSSQLNTLYVIHFNMLSMPKGYYFTVLGAGICWWVDGLIWKIKYSGPLKHITLLLVMQSTILFEQGKFCCFSLLNMFLCVLCTKCTVRVHYGLFMFVCSVDLAWDGFGWNLMRWLCCSAWPQIVPTSSDKLADEESDIEVLLSGCQSGNIEQGRCMLQRTHEDMCILVWNALSEFVWKQFIVWSSEEEV